MKEKLYLPTTIYLIVIIYIFRLLCLYVHGHIPSTIFNKHLLSDYHLSRVTKTGKSPRHYEAYVLMEEDN